MTFKLSGIPSTYAGWQVPIIMDGEGKVYIGQTGKVPGVTSWGFSVWLKRGLQDPNAVRLLTLPGVNGTLQVIGAELYVAEVRKGGGIWLTKIDGYVPR